MKHMILLTLILVSISAAAAQTRAEQTRPKNKDTAAAQPVLQENSERETVFNPFICAFTPVAAISGADFSGELSFSTGSDLIAIPAIATGFGWGAAAGYEMAFKNGFYMRSILYAEQSFHEAVFQESKLTVSALSFSWNLGISWRIVQKLGIYATAGWSIPYWLFVQNGYQNGSETSTVSYFGVEGIDAGFGADLTLIGRSGIFAEAIYRILDYGDASFADRTLVPIEYLHAAAWHFRIGLRQGFKGD
ncbi:MAG: porin family protein [Spirochaetes bacterium]|nr:porin family protein [Spirochaetota bacterium]MBU0956404.1 porin family protein [Spirochaetota bacterium]